MDSAGTAWRPEDMWLSSRLASVSVYLCFVLWLGPAAMKARSPLTVKPLVLLHNAFLVAFCAWWLYKLISLPGVMEYYFKRLLLCQPSGPEDAEIEMTLNLLSYLYCQSKVLELIDTVFFIVRKKEEHVSFLHVYHHTSMVLTSWYNANVFPVWFSIVVMTVNTAVHVVMYSYYFLAAIGPSMHKYLFWKRYITSMQMTQFVIIMTYLGYALVGGCYRKNSLVLVAFLQTSSYLLLFYKFYTKAYKTASDKKRLAGGGDDSGRIPTANGVKNGKVNGVHQNGTKAKAV